MFTRENFRYILRPPQKCKTWERAAEHAGYDLADKKLQPAFGAAKLKPAQGPWTRSHGGSDMTTATPAFSSCLHHPGWWLDGDLASAIKQMEAPFSCHSTSPST